MTTANISNKQILALVIMLVLQGCNQSKQGDVSMATPTKISMPEWQILEQKRVVFGHQSVGENILQGVQRLAKRDGIDIGIREQRKASTDKGISHFLIGENGDPISKIHDFSAAIDSGAGQGADLALMKLCYVDFDANTDARDVAETYIANLESLARKYPDVNFIAVTAPLTVVQTGAKAWIKQHIGKYPSGYVENIKRAEFNSMLRQIYQPKGRLFDLAKAETDFGGKKCRMDVNGQSVEALCPELTSDGGHLNERGQEAVATAFLNFASAFSTKQAAK
jgi:hypothetical protein